MVWTSPLTAVSTAALTAAQWNASVRDNLLETAVAKVTQSGSIVAGAGPNSLVERVPNQSSTLASGTTTNTSYTDLSDGAGAAITVTSGTKVFVAFSATLSNSTVNEVSYSSLDISGATTSAATDTRAIKHTSSTANAGVSCSHATVYSVTAGSNTFLMKYRGSGGTLTGNDRRVAAIPF